MLLNLLNCNNSNFLQKKNSMSEIQHQHLSVAKKRRERKAKTAEIKQKQLEQSLNQTRRRKNRPSDKEEKVIKPSHQPVKELIVDRHEDLLLESKVDQLVPPIANAALQLVEYFTYIWDVFIDREFHTFFIISTSIDEAKENLLQLHLKPTQLDERQFRENEYFKFVASQPSHFSDLEKKQAVDYLSKQIELTDDFIERRGSNTLPVRSILNKITNTGMTVENHIRTTMPRINTLVSAGHFAALL